MAVFVQSGCIRAKLVVFGQRGCIAKKNGFIRAKVVVFKQSGAILA